MLLLISISESLDDGNKKLKSKKTCRMLANSLTALVVCLITH